MRTFPVILLAVLICLLPPGQAESQDALRTKLGKKVRIKIAEGRPYFHTSAGSFVGSGEFVSGILHSASDTLTVLSDAEQSGEIQIPPGSIELAQIRKGERTYGAHGSGIGFLVGAVGGGRWGWGEGSTDTTQCRIFCLSKGKGAVLGGLVFGAVGGLAGGIVGTFIKSDRWEDLSISGVAGSVQPGGSLGIEVSLSLGG